MTKENTANTELTNKVNKASISRPIKTKHKFSGSEDEDFSMTLYHQTIDTLWLGNSDLKEREAKIKATLAAMAATNPNDELEGMLVAQMIALHNASMECFRRAMFPNPEFDMRQASLSQGNKLTRSYAMLMDTLDRYRGKAPTEQKVMVEHVNVYKGGQAIVGNVEK